MTTEHTPEEITAAAAFVDVINEWLTPSELGQVRALNRSSLHGGCATHVFCDANMALLQAMEKLDPAFDLDGDNEPQIEMINRIWDIARDVMQFRPATPRHFATSFPDFPAADMPADIPDHWRDESWNNDTCPSFALSPINEDGTDTRIWIDYADRAEATKRFTITTERPHFETVTLAQSDNWDEIRPLAIALADAMNL